MAPVIALAALKGGVGKSTLAALVSLALAARGRRVRVVDADEQGSAAAWLAESGGVEYRADAIEGGRDPHKWLGRLNADRDRADVVVVDLPPHLREQVAAALVAASLAVLPCRASALDLAALRRTLALVAEARAARRDRGPRVLIVPTMIDTRRLADRELLDELPELGEHVAAPIGSRSAFVDAAGGALPSARSKAGAELEALVKMVEAEVGL